MPRQRRYRIPGLPQHVVQRGNDRQPTFFGAEDYRKYRSFLELAAQEHGCAIHAYVQMTNHVHLLVTPEAEDSLPGLIQSVGRRYVRYINDRYERTGTLWDGRYKACLVQTDSYLINCYRYIELNPVRAGIAGAPGDYQYSSFACNGLGRPDPLVTPHSTYLALGSDPHARRANYRAAFPAQPDTAQARAIRQATAGGQLYGSEPFRESMALRLGRTMRPGKAGRPRKDGKIRKIGV
jgi:putative transposase